MASRYWVGGSGVMDFASTTHWSASSGGSGGASVPASADDVFFDANSGGGIITITFGYITFNSVNFTGWTGNFDNSGSTLGLMIAANSTLCANRTLNLFLLCINNNITLTSNGGGIQRLFINTGSNTLSLADDLTVVGYIYMNFGKLNANNKNVNCAYVWNSNPAAPCTLTLGSGTWTLTGGAKLWDIPNTTIVANTSNIVINGPGTFNGNDQIYNNITISSSCTISDNNSFNIFTISPGITVNFTAGNTQTVTSLISIGTSSHKITLQSAASGNRWNISKPSGSSTVSYTILSDSNATGGGIFNADSTCTDGGNNSGWIFQVAPDPSAIERTYRYEVYTPAGRFLGCINPNVDSEFAYSHDIGSPFTVLQITIANSPDIQFDAPQPILTEDSQEITDELGQTLYTENTPSISDPNNGNALIRKNNVVKVYEISVTYPNGLLVFTGWMSQGEDDYNASSASNIMVTCLSNGTELDNYEITGSSSLDQSQASQNSSVLVFTQDSAKFTSWHYVGQTFQPGAGVINEQMILLKLALQDVNHPVTLRIQLWNSANDYYGGGTPLASLNQSITSITPTDYLIDFGSNISVNPAQSYFISITPITNDGGYGVYVYYQNTDVYANGAMQEDIYSGTGSAAWAPSGSGGYDLYFKTYYSGGTTSSPFISQDPTIMLRSIIDSYVNRGGSIDYATGTTDLTGLSESYTFSIATVLEGIKKCLDLAPSDWYWYVDPATNILYFKETNTVADHLLIYGRHFNSLKLKWSIEEIKNKVYFTGGDEGGNNYLFKLLIDSTAITDNDGRIGLARLTDNRVLLTDTADTLMQNYVDTNKNKNYQATIRVDATTYDINLFKWGQIIGFESFGNYIDNLLLQIVHIERHDGYVIMGLGVLPRRENAKVEEIKRQLNQVSTIYNPAAPS